MTYRLLPAVWLCLGFAAAANGQRPAEGSAGFESESVRPLPVRLAEWNRNADSRWAARIDRATGQASMVHGGHLDTGERPRGDAGWFDLGRRMVATTAPLSGLDESTLVPDRVRFLPLAQVGSTDKWTVRFRQRFDGIDVEGAVVNVLFDDDGALLSVQTTAAVDRPGSPLPLVGADAAIERALFAFHAETGIPANQVGDPRLVWVQHEAGKNRETRLAWRVRTSWRQPDVLPVGRDVAIDARNARVLESVNTVHEFDVTGTVVANSSPGTAPDTGSNPEQAFPVPRAYVTSSQGTVVTDENGDFSIPGTNGPLNVSVRFLGDFANVQNDAGSNVQLSQSISGNGNTLTLNTSPTELTTSQANAYRSLNQLRDWIRSVNPTDSTADFQALANTNLNSSCNAFYDGFSTNYFTSGSGCPNTGFSSVVAHEQGHWLNDLYSTGNGPDGMGEGNADVFAQYLFDTPIVGDDFFGSGQDLRSGLNTRQYCGDGNGGCYGAVHTDGEVWMGAAWKIRDRLNLSLGDTAGDLVADSLFLGWMNAYDQSQIDSVIEAQWLTLDDDDGNIFNGTPHFTEIDGGMRDQGFPGIELQYFTFANVTELGDTLDEVGPYVVSADVTSNFGSGPNAVTLHYRVDDGVWQQTAMTPSGPAQYQGFLPGQTSPASVKYYVEASNSPTETNRFPAAGPDGPLSFVVGQRVQVFFDDFETDQGWTHSSYFDTSNDQDDWQRGVTDGDAGDADAAFSGSQIWGNDLGQPGWNGEYQNDVHSWLRSPLIDCSDATGTTLRFQRWLTVEKGQFDDARIRVNGTLVWSNDFATDTIDTEWSLQEIDISPWADGDPNVEIEFELQTDGGLTFGGWCVDDVELFYVDSADAGCPDPTTFCTTSPNSVGGGALIGSNGSTSIAANSFELTVVACPANQFGLFFYGPGQQSTPFGQGVLCVDGGGAGLIRIRPAVPTDFIGSGSRPVDFGIAPFDAGPGAITPGSTWNFQFWYRDPGLGFNLSNGLEVTFCP